MKESNRINLLKRISLGNMLCNIGRKERLKLVNNDDIISIIIIY